VSLFRPRQSPVLSVAFALLFSSGCVRSAPKPPPTDGGGEIRRSPQGNAEGITGNKFANFDNTRPRCSFMVRDFVKYDLHCRVVIVDGGETIATTITPTTTPTRLLQPPTTAVTVLGRIAGAAALRAAALPSFLNISQVVVPQTTFVQPALPVFAPSLGVPSFAPPPTVPAPGLTPFAPPAGGPFLAPPGATPSLGAAPSAGSLPQEPNQQQETERR